MKPLKTTRTIIFIAVFHACRIIGDEYRRRMAKEAKA